MPELFAAAPAAHDLLLVALLSLATGALALSGLVIGAVVANEYLAAAVPFVLVAACAFVLEGPARWLSPYTYLDLSAGPGAAPVDAVLAYWMIFAVLATALGTVLFVRKEAR